LISSININKINNSNYSINPWFITEITDGDGSSYVQIKPYKVIDGRRKFKFWLLILFYILVAAINISNYNMLQLIQSYFTTLNCTETIS
jgi:hypothetical protein